MFIFSSNISPAILTTLNGSKNTSIAKPMNVHDHSMIVYVIGYL